MTRDEALQYVRYCVDDACSPHDAHEAYSQEDARLVVWERGDDFDPVVVAVWSYLPGCRVEDSEAQELATDYLREEHGLGHNSPVVAPDFVL